MAGILAGLALQLPASGRAADVNVIGLTAGKAVLIIGNGKPVTLRSGQTAQGVRLIEASTDSALVEIDGRRLKLAIGHAISIGGGPLNAQRARLHADQGGHFITTVAINGVSLRFMVDTGATLVTLSSSAATRAGINYRAGEKALLQTANGVTTAYRVKLDTVRLGDIALSNVDGAVVEGSLMGELGLLGLSFLNRVEMRRDGAMMTLTRRY